ncbi:unnamed protein product, partial [Oppiella nova]
MIKMSSNYKEGLILKGWLEVLSGSDEDITSMNHSAMNYFDISSKSYRFNDPEVIIGKAKVLEKNSSFIAGVEQLNQAIVLYPRFLPAFIEKMKLQASLKDWEQTEGSKLLNDLLEDCRDTPDEGRIMIANAQLAEARGDIDTALSLLRDIKLEHGDHFVRSRELMALMYLKHRKDRRLYAGCYREILDKKPTTQSFLMLGDAYMHILEPERAIEIYEQALKKNPKDWILTRKVGQALIKTHFYEKAVTYYKAAIKTSGQNAFRYDLAHLLW